MNELGWMRLAPAIGLAVGGFYAALYGLRRVARAARPAGELTSSEFAMVAMGAVAGFAGTVWFFVLWRRVRAVEHRHASEFLRATMPRTIYELLLGVAGSDGRIEWDEREVVADLMTRRLPDTVLLQDLKNWTRTVEPPSDPVTVARNLALVLTEHERAAVWQCCREVAAVDGVDGDEHDVLQRIRAVLKPTDFAAGLRK